ncbi:type IV pilus biogenesis/stability protein PilW [Endozoicomonas sp. ALD040]|uniref:type IV pilus biogenesis/stability protein PilW n=1 Tax=unclassified Endozoicomonas TaxID=2644528 RepID=UPI003BAFFC24
MIAKLGISAVLFSIILSGCVTTGGPEPVNEGEAVRSYLELARGYVQQGLTEKAVKPINRALEIQPRSADAFGMLGLVYQLQGEASLAETSFRKALSFNPDSSEIHNNFGVFLFSQNRLSEAYREFEQAAGDVRYSSRSRAYENLGLVALKQGRRSLAAEHFDKALKLNSNLPRASLELAAILEEQGQFREAWKYYQVFTRLSRQNERSLRLGVRLARVNGDQDAAASYSLQLGRLFPSSTGEGVRSRSGYEY